MTSRFFYLAALATFSLLGSASAFSASYCGALKNGFGPFDYRKKASLVQETELVESAHFTAEVENLIKGNTGQIGGDLDYTLRAFPNHHRALASVAKLALRSKSPKDSAMKYSFDCYFERAMRFTPNDDGVYAVYGTFLYKKGDVTGAVKEFQRALEIKDDNAPANYNLGLIYLQKKQYDEALKYAKKAYALDYPVPGLKNALVAAGKWDNP
ncbi:MAG: tetratricopeptide repeat protein [Tardiphaga sp.]|uniref:tetratricopeptide repeat protein n=1 Tax=Tardiphaga sp. TaxID=1926292 RepID=UPI0019A018D5|nr:tetratricopeptide repeat protein [Tardiphaga sp.]MBC7584821.1 tetratricopeptide repeat protein [Tardiphaga sp.]